MIVVSVVLLLTAGASFADRLDFGTEWHCVSPFEDKTEADFTIGSGESASVGKKLVVTRSSTTSIPVGTTGYGSDLADKNKFYDARQAKKNPDYPYAEFMQGFYGDGVSFETKWWARKPEIEISIQTYDEKNRADPERRNEKSFGLICRSVN